ncbi:putative isoamylase 1, chloroplastic [Cocos nucifera]|nr:putative isoamylase 1, chloroplastic [Cocos nucifera]
MELAMDVPSLVSPSSFGRWRSELGVFRKHSSVSAKRERSRDRVGTSVVMMTMSGIRNRKESLVINASSTGAADVETAVAERPGLAVFKVLAGTAAPLGATACNGGVNFAICSSSASAATLCLFTLSDLKANRVTEQISLDPLFNKTGDIWHVFVQGEFKDILYGYKFDGKFSPEEGHYFDYSRILLDPYAKAVISRGDYGVLGPGGDCWPQMAGMIPISDDEVFFFIFYSLVSILLELQILVKNLGFLMHKQRENHILTISLGKLMKLA